jgi:hypothetical protein
VGHVLATPTEVKEVSNVQKEGGGRDEELTRSLLEGGRQSLSGSGQEQGSGEERVDHLVKARRCIEKEEKQQREFRSTL